MGVMNLLYSGEYHSTQMDLAAIYIDSPMPSSETAPYANRGRRLSPRNREKRNGRSEH